MSLQPYIDHRCYRIASSSRFCYSLRAQPSLSPLAQEAVIVAFPTLASQRRDRGLQVSQDFVRIDRPHRDLCGVSGEMSAHGLERLPEVLNQYAPDLLVLIYGGNDLLSTADQENTRTNLEAKLRLVMVLSISVVMLGVPASGLISSSAGFYADLAARALVPIDTRTLPAILSNGSLKSDLIHPNADGYRVTAEPVYSLLAEHGAL